MYNYVCVFNKVMFIKMLMSIQLLFLIYFCRHNPPYGNAI